MMLQGVENFRDFGGFAVAGGGRVQPGRLFRSGAPAQATDDDLTVLAAIPIRTVVDLRRPTERREAPSRLTHLPTILNDDGDRSVAPHMEFMRLGAATAEAVEAYVTDYYRNAFFEPRHRDLFARSFEALSEIDGAILIHCAAGKHRTGLLAALIRTALGGAWEETAADFVLTNSVTLTPTKQAAAATRLQALLGAPPSDAILQAFLGVWPHHLECAFQALDARCGSVDTYLMSLGVNAARRDRIANRLVA